MKFGYREQSASRGFASRVNRSYLHTLFCSAVEESPKATLPNETLSPVHRQFSGKQCIYF